MGGQLPGFQDCNRICAFCVPYNSIPAQVSELLERTKRVFSNTYGTPFGWKI
jgi:hypothetical protein